MIHMHILSWVLAIILFFAAYFNYSKTQGPTPFYKPIHMMLRLFMVLVLISGLWLLIQEFSSGSNGGSHMLLTFKMVGGFAAIALMETTLIQRKKAQPTTALLWWTIIIIIITMILGVVLPWGPITKLFGM